MNIGIVTVWDERGAGYVSKIYRDYLSNYFNVFIYWTGITTDHTSVFCSMAASNRYCMIFSTR